MYKEALGQKARRNNEFESIAADMHVVTNDLMAGLGNTFSDFLGVALGSAALEIAKFALGLFETPLARRGDDAADSDADDSGAADGADDGSDDDEGDMTI